MCNGAGHLAPQSGPKIGLLKLTPGLSEHFVDSS